MSDVPQCERCGFLLTSGSGCGCAEPPPDPTWPDIRARVAAGEPVPAWLVKKLLEDYDRLRGDQ